MILYHKLHSSYLVEFISLGGAKYLSGLRDSSLNTLGTLLIIRTHIQPSKSIPKDSKLDVQARQFPLTVRNHVLPSVVAISPPDGDRERNL